MLYRNTKTGVMVDVQSDVSGDWEPVVSILPEEPQAKAEDKAPEPEEKKKTAGKKAKKK